VLTWRIVQRAGVAMTGSDNATEAMALEIRKRRRLKKDICL